jgi:pilus assembly protein Flp/PilA
VLMHLVDLARSLVGPGDADGQGLAEYALILALIAIVAIVALLFLGSQISDKLSIVGNAI